MSLDAEYIFSYEFFDDLLREEDMAMLRDKYGGDFLKISHHCGGTIYWEKPKYTLLPEEINSLRAAQIFERLGAEDVWVEKKGYGLANKPGS